MASVISAGTTSGTALNLSSDTSGVLQLASNSGTTALTITTAQNVGIGTSSPQAPLNVSYSDASRNDCLRLTNTNTGGYGPWINFYGNYSSGYSFAKIGAENETTGATLRFHTADTSKVSQERMRIDSSGNVGIGTTSPAYKLDVNGVSNATCLKTSGTPSGTFSADTWFIQNEAANTARAYVCGTNSSSFGSLTEYTATSTGSAIAARAYDNTSHVWYTNNAERARIDGSGNLLVGTTTTGGNPTTGLGFNYNSGSSYFAMGHITGTASGTSFQVYNYNATAIGSITQSGTTAVLYNTTSDQRLKENIVDAPSGNINDIKVRSFDWIADGSHQTYGMVAQELLEVAPYAVHQPVDPEEMMAVDYSKLVPMMIKEIQDLKAQVTALQLQIDVMK